MNEEERSSLDPEVAESIRSAVEEVAQSAIDMVESHEEANGISYVNARELNSILLLIREGFTYATIEPHEGVPHTYILSIGGATYYLNSHHYTIVLEEIRNHESTEEKPIESLPDSEEYSPLSEEEEKLLAQAVEEAHNEIPTNSGSLLIDESTSRFSSAIWYEAIRRKTVILAGVGGIGSYVGFLLARIKPAALFIYDPDVVETVNMSGQLYSREDVGSTKVSALLGMISKYCDYNSVFAVPESFDESNDASDIMICGFDNMTARKIFFNKWSDHVRSKSEAERANCLYIDGRLTAEEFQVLCIKGDDKFNINRYEKEFLFSDIEADATICSYKQTTFMANMIASVMVNLFVNFVANQCKPLIDRDLPFYTTYSAKTMYYKTEA
jgi:hypothetical protein